MPDTIQTRAQLITALADNTSGAITPQIMRNWLISITLALIPTTVKTANYTAAESDFVPCDATAGSFTVTLPTAPADKTVACVKMVATASSHTVTIARGGISDVFNKAGGSTSVTLTLLNQGALLQYAASTGIWYVLGDDLPLSQLDARYTTPAYVTTALGSYLPLAGGVMTGNLDMSSHHIINLSQIDGQSGSLYLNAIVTLGSNLDMSGNSIANATLSTCNGISLAGGPISGATSIGGTSLAITGALADGTYSVTGGGSITIANGVITAIT